MQGISRVAVGGATGRVGRHIVDVLNERGYGVVPIARANGVDVITGQGLAAVLQGVDCIIDASTGPSAEEQPATEFFTTATRNLQTLGQQAGVQRLVTVSIIGCDRFTGGYGAAKIAHERAVLGGPIPGRVLRAAQFHEFVSQLMAWGTRGDVCYVQEMRTQLVAARTVAEGLVDLAISPNGFSVARIPEIGGPREESMVEAAKLLAARRAGGLRIEGVVDTSDPDHAVYTSGALLPAPYATLAGPTFEAWLATQAAD
ncbi:MAG: NAD(P)H-binding protein [Chloroflexi bacterium]|nr:NAD(P)H-binding protein [Chloroflexota bacterium]